MKFIKVLILIIMFFIVILFFKINNNNTSNINNIKTEINISNNKITKEELIVLVNRSDKINNYTLRSNKNKTIFKYKENRGVFYKTDNENAKIYVDYINDKQTVLEKKNKIAYISKNFQKISLNSKKESFFELINRIEEYKTSEDYFNDYKCIVIEFDLNYTIKEDFSFEKDVQNNNKKQTNKIWIDKNTGVVMKIEAKIDDEIKTTESYYEFNNVTDNDVEVPDLSEYKIINN